MNGQSSVADLSAKRDEVQARNAISRAHLEGYEAGYAKGKRVYEYLVWALALYGIVISIAYIVR
jgi:hypothetical protein